MKIQEYIDKLYNEIDFEEDCIDCISDLQEETPVELHGNVMKLLKNEKVKENSIVNRKYFSLAAAIFIFVVLVSGLKNFRDVISPKKAVEQKNFVSSGIAAESAGMYDKSEVITNDSSNKSKESLETAFEITTKDSDIIEYLKNHGESTGNNLYLLNKKNYEEFRILLKEKNLSLVESNDPQLRDHNKKIDSKMDEFIQIKILN